MPSFFLTTYAPLVSSRVGREASQEYGIPPFVDGSIRREPDLENDRPGISCLCRANKFAPRLGIGDVVAYMARKGSFGTGHPHRRLAAVLRVLEILPTHAGAAQWYQDQKLPLPSNCLVPGNAAKPFEHSHQIYSATKCLGAKRTYREWDASYRVRAKQYGTFVVCEVLFRDLTWDAPIIEDDHLRAAFGAIPGTQNPARLPLEACERLLGVLGLRVPPFGQ